MIKQLLEALKSRQTDLIEGTSLDLELPVTDELANQVLDEQLGDLEEIKRLQVHFEPGNVAKVQMKIKVPTGLFNVNLPEKTLRLRIDPPTGLPRNPVIRLRIVDGLNRLERKMLHVFDGLLNKRIPQGVKIDDDHISMDVRKLLEREKLGHMADYVQQLAVRTEAGRLLVETHIEVPAATPS